MASRPDPLRPERLADFTGQPDLVRRLAVVLDAAASRDELPDHLLFSGPPGLGKTTLANIVAAECGAGFVATSGPALERPGDLASLLCVLPGRTVLFIDEIHRLPRAVEETLYPAMEDGALDLPAHKSDRSRVVRVHLEPFCLIGATTLTGMLSAPLRDRFGWATKLTLYDTADLARIVARSAGLLDVDIDDSAALEIARRSRGTPRIANRLLRHVRDFSQQHQRPAIDGALSAEALEWFGVDSVGLDATARQILYAMCVTFGGNPVGLGTLAAAVGESPTTVEQMYEPYLMHLGFLVRTPRGRVPCDAARQHLGLPVPPGERELFAAH